MRGGGEGAHLDWGTIDATEGEAKEDGAEVHGPRDDEGIVGEVQRGPVDGGPKDPSVPVLHQLLQDACV